MRTRQPCGPIALRRRLATAAVMLAATAAVALPVRAQTFPEAPVRLIVPYPPGGITDILARTIAQRISTMWSQRMFVENRAGASGNIGAAAAAKAPADGHTLLFGNASTHAVNPSLFKNLPFDPMKDFVPITMVAKVSNVLLVRPDFPAKTLSELIARAKAAPGEIMYASNSVGSSNHLSGELLKTVAGIDIRHVPYKSASGAAVDLIGGRVSMMFDNLTTAMPYLSDGRLRALAVTSEKRVSLLPDVPTMVESGLPNFVVTPWWGIFAPAGTPPAVVAKLNRDIVAVLNTEEVRSFLAKNAAEVVGDSPEQFKVFVQGEADRWSKVVKESGATAD